MTNLFNPTIRNHSTRG